MKPTLLYLTNFYHNAEGYYEKEDLILINFLRKHFKIIVSHPLDCEPVEDCTDGVMLRNIWPEFEYKRELEKVIQRFLKKKFKLFNAPNARFASKGKHSLIDLYNDNYPVIPTVGKKTHLSQLPKCSKYIIKPKDKCSSIGIEVLRKKELLDRNLRNYVIQPFINIKHEISLYFLDNKFQYAFKTKRKVVPYELEMYRPSTREMDIAKKFVKWNTLSYGIQRIDLCRSEKGELLLVEIEDTYPTLKLLQINKEVRQKFFRNIVNSLRKNLKISQS